MIRKFDSSGAVVCWDSQRVLRQNAESAFGSVGKGKFVPAVNHLAALTDAAKTVASDGGLNLPGLPLKYFTLDRSSTGIGVYREIRGTQENEYQFMFSVGVLAETGRVVFLKQAPTCPLYIGPNAINQLDAVYRESTRYLTASAEFMRVMFADADPADRDKVRRNLEEYCSLDTSGMLDLLRYLEGMSNRRVIEAIRKGTHRNCLETD
jgi:hypothetical protein